MLDTVLLSTESDWEDCALLEKLPGKPDPYLNPVYQCEVWKFLGKGAPCWFLHHDGLGRRDRAAFAAFWTEERHSGLNRLKSRLRSLDWGVMAMPPALVPAGCEIESFGLLAESGPEIARRTGLGVVSLHKLGQDSADMLGKALGARRIPHDRVKFNTRWRIRMEGGFDRYMGGHSRKTRYNIHRSERLLTAKLGHPLRLEGLRADECGAEPFQQAVAKVLSLHQAAFAASSEDARLRGALYARVIEEWRRRGWAETMLLWAGDRLVAGQVNLRLDHLVWVVLMEHDPSLAPFSPGIQLLLKVLEAAPEESGHVIDLGGGGNAWKSIWANETEDTWTMTWPLGGLSGAVWRARSRSLGRRGTA